VTLAWTAFSLVRTIAVYVGGPIADRVDRRFLLAAGWGFYAIVYALMAVARSPAEVVALLVVYGLYYGAVEPSERAIVADLAPAALRGTAFGWYHGMVGIAALPASALFGWLWSARNAGTAFGAGALLAALACIALLVWAAPARVDEAAAR
jgi:MFS family permease